MAVACPIHHRQMMTGCSGCRRQGWAQRGSMGRGGRSIGATKGAGRRQASTAENPSDRGVPGRVHPGRSPQSSIRLGIGFVEVRGRSGAAEQEPRAQGDRRSGGSGNPSSGADGPGLGSRTARSIRRLASSARFTQGWLQAARACGDSSALAAASASPAAAHDLAHRLGNVRIMTIDRLDDPGLSTGVTDGIRKNTRSPESWFSLSIFQI
jgi:hypothetical protein